MNDIFVYVGAFLAAISIIYAVAQKIQNSELKKELTDTQLSLDSLRGAMPDAEARAKAAADRIISDAEASKLKIEGQVKQALDALSAKERQSEREAEAKAARIISEAEARASLALKQIKETDDTLATKTEMLARLSRLVEAERNLVEGWQDKYTLPTHMLLDGLMDHVGWSEAGEALKEAREKTRKMVKEKKAIICDYGDVEYKKDATRLLLDAFNSEVDLALEKIKGEENVGKVIQEIKDVAESLGDYGFRCMRATVSSEYVEARVDEAKWGAIAFELRKKEREEQREKMRELKEAERVERELERARREAEREEEVAKRALMKAQEEELRRARELQREHEAKMRRLEEEMKKASQRDEEERRVREQELRAEMSRLLEERERQSEEERAAHELQTKQLEAQLKEAEERNKRALSMAQQTKKGHVYVISNFGSFGEAMLKVGMTRRLDPMDRVWELSDASVPFDFDVHALIASEDAPGLENRLHRAMAELRVNKVNMKKEFFRIGIKDIREIMDKIGVRAEWTLAAKAQEYRETLALEDAFRADPDVRDKWLARYSEDDGS